MPPMAVLLSLCAFAVSGCPNGSAPQCSHVVASGVPAWSTVISPDGSQVAVAAGPEGVSVFSTAGAVLASWPHLTYVYDTRFLPDGKSLAIASPKMGVSVVSLATGRVRWNDSSSIRAISVACSPDGTRIASGHVDGRIQVRDASNGTVLITLHDASVNTVRYSPDGSTIVAAAEGKCVSYDASSGHPTSAFPLPEGQLFGTALSPNGQLFAATFGDTAAVYRLNGTTPLQVFGRLSSAARVAFSPDSTVVAVGVTGQIRFYDVASGGLVGGYPTHSSIPSYGLDWHAAGGHLVSGEYWTKKVMVWSAPEGGVSAKHSRGGAAVFTAGAVRAPAPATPATGVPAAPTEKSVADFLALWVKYIADLVNRE